MIVKKATQVGNTIIRTKSKQVTDPKSEAVSTIIRNLVDSMRFHGLVGMAAPQIGKNLRVFVTEIRREKLRKGDSAKNVDELRIFINPKVVSSSWKTNKGWEGCGSVAAGNLFAVVTRPQSVIVEASDQKGQKFKLEATDLLARVIQHEMDHLNGVVFTDRAETKTYMSRDEHLKLRAKTT